MKPPVLIGMFVALCIGLAGSVVWILATPGHRGEARPEDARESRMANSESRVVRRVSNEPTDEGEENTVTMADAPSVPSDSAALPAAPAPSSKPASAPASAPVRSPVRWAADPDRRAARDSLELARETLRTDPDHELALRDALDAVRTLGDVHSAADVLGRLVRLHPDDTSLRFEYGVALLNARRNIEAIATFKRVTQASPAHGRAWFNLGAAHRDAGHLAAAARAFGRAIELQPTPEAYARRGEVNLTLGRYTAAADDFRVVCALDPAAGDAKLNLSLALQAGGKLAEAGEILDGFLVDHPTHVPALNRRAAIAWETYQETQSAGDLGRAIMHWAESIEIDPGQEIIGERLAEARDEARAR